MIHHSPMIHEHYAIVSEATQARYDKAHAEFVRASETYHAAWMALIRESYVRGEMADAGVEEDCNDLG